MLVTLNHVLSIAEERKFAIGSFNTPNQESVQAVITAAEELNLPVIIQFAQCHDTWISLDVIGPIMIAAAERANVPVCVHLDHGETLDYLQRALNLGFTSIMYDGSTSSYEDNRNQTRKAVMMAAKTGASVEAELGSMGKRETGTGETDAQSDSTKIYTDPVLACQFVQETGIDALACSFGTTHGIYLTEPKLDFDVVRKVRELTEGKVPIVMHGGSGVSKDDYSKAIAAGVRKVNYFTYMDKAGGSAAAEYLRSVQSGTPVFFSAIMGIARKSMQENAKNAMKMFAGIG